MACKHRGRCYYCSRLGGVRVKVASATPPPPPSLTLNTRNNIHAGGGQNSFPPQFPPANIGEGLAPAIPGYPCFSSDGQASGCGLLRLNKNMRAGATEATGSQQHLELDLSRGSHDPDGQQARGRILESSTGIGLHPTRRTNMGSQHNFSGSYGKTERDYYCRSRAAAGRGARPVKSSILPASKASVRRVAYAEHRCSAGWLIMFKLRYLPDQPAMRCQPNRACVLQGKTLEHLESESPICTTNTGSYSAQ
jgi:hypothetical protein